MTEIIAKLDKPYIMRDHNDYYPDSYHIYCSVTYPDGSVHPALIHRVHGKELAQEIVRETFGVECEVVNE